MCISESESDGIYQTSYTRETVRGYKQERQCAKNAILRRVRQPLLQWKRQLHNPSVYL